jgi:uncharacterized membrane protein
LRRRLALRVNAAGKADIARKRADCSQSETLMTQGHALGVVEESVVIRRPVEQVFAYYEDFRNLPDFLGDVMRIELTGERTSRWTIKAPLGLEVHWSVVVTDIQPNAFIAYQTGSVTAAARWEINFSPGTEPGTTIVREVMSIPGGLLTEAALAAVGKPPAREVRANLERLKEVLETGHVTNRDYVVTGKFGDRCNGH